MADDLKFTARVRVWLEKNESTIVNQEYLTEDQTFTELTNQRVVIAVTSSTTAGLVQEIDLGGVDTGYGLFVECDRSIFVGVDDSTNLISIGDNGSMFLTGSFTHVYVRNDSTTYQATATVLVFDRSTS